MIKAVKVQPLLEINNLSVAINGSVLLSGISMEVLPGEIHVVFGPNGSGKSSLINTVMGLPPYDIVQGDIRFNGKSLLGLAISERARLGIGLAFQHPPAVEGVSLAALLETMDRTEGKTQELADRLRMSEHLERDINAGFSGGEMKRSELLQLLSQDPTLVLLDEPESGVDVDSIQLLAEVVETLFEKDRPILERTRGGIIVTHTGSILEHLNANQGYVMIGGRLLCAGSPLEIFTQIKKHGFNDCIREARERSDDRDAN